jgi:hypothetical protein
MEPQPVYSKPESKPPIKADYAIDLDSGCASTFLEFRSPKSRLGGIIGELADGVYTAVVQNPKTPILLSPCLPCR